MLAYNNFIRNINIEGQGKSGNV